MVAVLQGTQRSGTFASGWRLGTGILLFGGLLRLNEAVVFSFLGDQFLVSAGFNYPPCFADDDAVRIAHSREPVSNNNRGPVAKLQ